MKSTERESLGLSICGLNLRLSYEPALFKEFLVRRYSRFIVSNDERPDLAVVAVAQKERPRWGRTAREIVVERRFNRVLLSRTDFAAEIARDRASGAFCRGKVACTPNEYSFDAFLRSTLQAVLVEHGRIFVHAAAVAGNSAGRRCAYLFPGRSGMGKSTLAAKFGDAISLSDELPCLAAPSEPLCRGWESDQCRRASAGLPARTVRVLRPAGQPASPVQSRAAAVFGTPFHGRFSSQGRNLRLPLAGIFFLERGFGPRASALGQPEALLRLMSLIACFEKYESVSEAMLRIGQATTASVPSFVFGFDKSESPEAIAARLSAAVDRVARRGRRQELVRGAPLPSTLVRHRRG